MSPMKRNDFEIRAYVNLHIVLSLPPNYIVKNVCDRLILESHLYLLILSPVALHNAKYLHKCFFFSFFFLTSCHAVPPISTLH